MKRDALTLPWTAFRTPPIQQHEGVEGHAGGHGCRGGYPLLYGALYLAAFYDPYGALGEVPVAIVNEDDGAVLDGSETNVGNQIVENLEDSDDGMQWNFVSAEKGQEGLENGDYYLMLTIPPISPRT